MDQSCARCLDARTPCKQPAMSITKKTQNALLSMQSKLGPAGCSFAKLSLHIASQVPEPAGDGPSLPWPVRQPFVGVRVSRVLLRELWNVLLSCTLQGVEPGGKRSAYRRTQCPSAPVTISCFGDMESNMRNRAGVRRNGAVTPPAPSSEAEDGYDTSTAMDSSKVCQYALKMLASSCVR